MSGCESGIYGNSPSIQKHCEDGCVVSSLEVGSSCEGPPAAAASGPGTKGAEHLHFAQQGDRSGRSIHPVLDQA